MMAKTLKTTSLSLAKLSRQELLGSTMVVLIISKMKHQSIKKYWLKKKGSN